MAIKTRDELLASVRSIIGENTSDEALALIEDVTDTMTNLEANNSEDWKKRYEDNDKMWRDKYRDRFYSSDPLPLEDKQVEVDEDKPLTYDSLFKEDK